MKRKNFDEKVWYNACGGVLFSTPSLFSFHVLNYERCGFLRMREL